MFEICFRDKKDGENLTSFRDKKDGENLTSWRQ
jgi:hypothetical protein